MPLPLSKQNKVFTYADYLTWDESERWEIIDGIAYAQATPSTRHQEISVELTTQFHNYLKGKKCKVYPAPFSVVFDLEKNNHDINKF
jgi:Uma2 family endonuclease